MFVFQEPSLLSSLQDNGLTDVMLHALLIKDVSLVALCLFYSTFYNFAIFIQNPFKYVMRDICETCIPDIHQKTISFVLVIQ